MFVYEKKLQYPVKIKNANPRLAALIISQYGGPDGELGASLRYLSQRYSMPYPELKGLLTDIGTEELGHLEMVGTIVHQLTRNLTEEQIRAEIIRLYKSGEDMAYSNIRKNHQYLLAYGMKKLGGGSWAEARRACGIMENFRLPKEKRRPSKIRMKKCWQPGLF